jgi:predicted N-acetyltransferase YhbS
MEVEILEARTTADRARVADVARLAFGRTAVPPLVHAARRIGSALCSRASAWLGTVDGEPAVSLLRYDFTLRRGDERRRAFGLGGVATRPDFRSRGLATRLCREAAERHGGAGLLFSAIPPAFYERLGYVAVPAWEHHCERADALAASGPRAELTPLDPRRDTDRLAASWDAAHDGWYLDRDDERWRATLGICPDDLWLAVDAGGYLRVAFESDEMHIVERCTPDPDGALRAAAALADGRKITTWLPPDPLLIAHFEDRGRATTRPMLLGVDAPETARFSPADYF